MQIGGLQFEGCSFDRSKITKNSCDSPSVIVMPPWVTSETTPPIPHQSVSQCLNNNNNKPANSSSLSPHPPAVQPQGHVRGSTRSQTQPAENLRILDPGVRGTRTLCGPIPGPVCPGLVPCRGAIGGVPSERWGKGSTIWISPNGKMHNKVQPT